jgi:hypothetical protein
MKERYPHRIGMCFSTRHIEHLKEKAETLSTIQGERVYFKDIIRTLIDHDIEQWNKPTRENKNETINITTTLQNS